MLTVKREIVNNTVFGEDNEMKIDSNFGGINIFRLRNPLKSSELCK